MSPSTIQRISLIKQYIDPYQAKILEIGALDSPTFRTPECCISYVDYASREELSKKGKSNPRYEYERLVDVNYVICGDRYSNIIAEKFDLIIANHIIEHIPDVISWLHDLGSLLLPGGMIFLSVPDRRYTFDIARRESNFIDIIRPHLTRQIRPDFLNILDHLWHHKSVKAPEIWEGTHFKAAHHMRFSHDEAITNAEGCTKQPYSDVHCHVFTESSFRELMGDLRGFGFLGFKDYSLVSVIKGSNEFHVVLKNFDPTDCIRVIV